MAKPILQSTLMTVVMLRAKVEQEQAKLAVAEQNLTAALKAGLIVKPGVLTAHIKVWERRSVAWKQVVIREKGQEYADRVFSATKPEKHESLVVALAG